MNTNTSTTTTTTVPSSPHDPKMWDEKLGRTETGSSDSASVLERASQRTTAAKERIVDTASSLAKDARERLQTTSNSAKEKLADIKQRVGETGTQATESVKSSFEKHPLAFLGGALALGIAVGMALPNSRRENKQLAPTADKLREKANEVKEEAIGAVQGAADAAAERLDEEVEHRV